MEGWARRARPDRVSVRIPCVIPCLGVCVFARMRMHVFKQTQALADGDKAALQKQAEALKVAYDKKKAEYEAKVPAPMHS